MQKKNKMIKSYRILSIEARDIYRQTQKNGVAVGYTLPAADDEKYFWRFKNQLDGSLDTFKLEQIYEGTCGIPFSVKDSYDNEYTLAVINVEFSRKYTPKKDENGKRITKSDKPKDRRALREFLYENGFNVNGVHYVRYKRSAGSSRSGKCLFIDERLLSQMSEWGECGLKAEPGALASWESYKALSLSAINFTIDIPLDGILFVPDYKTTFEEKVVSVKLGDNNTLEATPEIAKIENNIWDGESLLDESLFTDDKKHMLLLRNKFFKSCAFRTKLQKWIKDNGITLDDLKNRGFITLATDISQIVMVTTESSLKYLKFAGKLTEDNIREWAKHVDNTFGVVKCDKPTRFFRGRMVRGSYQFFNTIGLNKEQVDELIEPSIDYLKAVRNNIDVMRFHFKSVIANDDDDKDDDDYEKPEPDRLAERADVVFKLLDVNDDFKYTELYKDFRDDLVDSQRKALRKGRLLLHGTNATLFGNGPELLKYIAGENIETMESELKPGRVRCTHFGDGAKLLCARSPHITMGNLYCVQNDLGGDIWRYFDLGDNVVCVNAIGENIQQRLNGCDYDSDSMLITDNDLLIKTAEKYAEMFEVPVCAIQENTDGNLTGARSLLNLDYLTSVNKVGEIVNLAQKLNSIIWDRLNKGNRDIRQVYLDVCKLAVLSGLEIDKAKKVFDNIDIEYELDTIRKKYSDLRYPNFFKEIRYKHKQWHPAPEKTENEKASLAVHTAAANTVVEKGKRKGKYRDLSVADEIDELRSHTAPDKKAKKKEEEEEDKYTHYDTAMDYIYEIAKGIRFNKGKDKYAKKLPISSLFRVEPATLKDIAARDKIIEICEKSKQAIVDKCNEFEARISGASSGLYKADKDAAGVIIKNIQDIKSERDKTIKALITDETVLCLVLEHFEQTEYEKQYTDKVTKKKKTKLGKKDTIWNIYAPLLDNKIFLRMLKASVQKCARIEEVPFDQPVSGEYFYLHGFRVRRIKAK